MKTALISMLIFFFSTLNFAWQSEKEAVQQVVQSAYVDSIHNRTGIEKISEGFHPDFETLDKRNDMLTKFPIYSWIETGEQAMFSDETTTKKTTITAKFPLIDIAGDAAMAKVDLYRNEQHLFTNFLLLYKLEKGWKILSKTYYRIPE